MQAGDGCQRSSRWGKTCVVLVDFFGKAKEGRGIWDFLSMSHARGQAGSPPLQTEETGLLLSREFAPETYSALSHTHTCASIFVRTLCHKSPREGVTLTLTIS